MLILVGLACAVLFILNVVVKTLLRRERVGFIDLMLAAAVTGLLVAAVTIQQLGADGDLMTLQTAQAVGLAVGLVGLITLVVEAARKQRVLGSRGMLSLGVGVLIALSTFTVPYSAVALAYPTSTPVQVAALAISRSATATPRPPTRVPPTPTVQPPTATAQPTRTPQPSLTPWTYVTRTPLPTATAVTPCLATVENNLRLRALPSTEAETLLVISFETVVSLIGRDQTSTWWMTEYEGQSGWLDGEYLTRLADCDRLPVTANGR